MDQFVSEPISGEPEYRKVETYIRARIADGTWPIGARLPSGTVLAENLGTSLFTVQTAMKHLCSEGLIERKTRIGTHVRGGSVQLTCAGIYFGHDFWRDPEDAFNFTLSRELQRQWEERGIQTRVWVDDRPKEKQSTPYPPIQMALKRREVQALLASSVTASNLPWLKSANVPTTFQTPSLNIPQQVTFDLSQIVRGALEQLRSQGCRTVGIICSCPIESLIQRSSESGSDFYNAFFDGVKELGMETRNEWVRIPTQWTGRREDYGYQQFNELWNQKARPDGIFVYPDMAARGAVTGILARRVDVPRELKVVLHRNDQISYICPFPVAQVVTQVSVLAAAMIQHIYRQIQGEPARRALCSALVEPSKLL